jgi:hypothetical protein
MTASVLCLLAGALRVVVPAAQFTLAWEHTVEKVAWEEDYVVAGAWLQLSAARVRGSGAGMEPPNDAVLRDGVWHYRPALHRFRSIALAHSTFGTDYRLCIDGNCRPLSDLIAPELGVTTLAPCAPAAPPPSDAAAAARSKPPAGHPEPTHRGRSDRAQ